MRVDVVLLSSRVKVEGFNWANMSRISQVWFWKIGRIFVCNAWKHANFPVRFDEGNKEITEVSSGKMGCDG